MAFSYLSVLEPFNSIRPSLPRIPFSAGEINTHIRQYKHTLAHTRKIYVEHTNKYILSATGHFSLSNRGKYIYHTPYMIYDNNMVAQFKKITS